MRSRAARAAACAARCFFADGFVTRGDFIDALRHFLKFAFGIVMAFGAQNCVNLRFDERDDHFAYRFDAAVEVQCANQRFECAAQNSGAFAHKQKFAQIDAAGKIGEHFGAYQRRAEAGQFTFSDVGEMVVKIFTGDKIENGIAQKFQPFIVAQGRVWHFVEV